MRYSNGTHVSIAHVLEGPALQNDIGKCQSNAVARQLEAPNLDLERYDITLAACHKVRCKTGCLLD